MKDGQPQAIHLKDYEAPNYLVETTELHFDLDEEATTVTSKLTVRRNPEGNGSSELTLDGSELELVDVAIDGRVLAGNEYRLEDESLTLFDVAEDPGEAKDLSKSMPDRLEVLKAAWDRYAKDVGVVPPE